MASIGNTASTPLPRPTADFTVTSCQRPAVAADVAQRLADRVQRAGRRLGGLPRLLQRAAHPAHQGGRDGEADQRRCAKQTYGTERRVDNTTERGADHQHGAPGAAAQRVGGGQVGGIDHIGQCRAGGRGVERFSHGGQADRDRPDPGRARAAAPANSSAIATMVATFAMTMSRRRSNRSASVPGERQHERTDRGVRGKGEGAGQPAAGAAPAAA